jgi:hypothetical protein
LSHFLTKKPSEANGYRICTIMVKTMHLLNYLLNVLLETGLRLTIDKDPLLQINGRYLRKSFL